MKTEATGMLQTYSSPALARPAGSVEPNTTNLQVASIGDPYGMERSELEAYLQSSDYFPTKASLLEFARRYNVPVNTRTQREEIIRLCLRMLHDIPAGFAGLRAAEKEHALAYAGGAATRKVLEDVFTGSKSEARSDAPALEKIINDLVESILRCHEASLLLAQVRRTDASFFAHAVETCEGPIETHVRLLRNLVVFAKLEAGEIQLRSGPFRLRDFLGKVLQELTVAAHQKGLEFRYEVGPDIPDALIGDATRLQQVLINLVENAIKFTEQGEIVVKVQPARFNAQSQ